MNILIVYYSLTGNTAKVAQTIHKALLSKQYNSVLKKLTSINISDLDKYDLIFLGSACHDSDLAKPVKQFLVDIPVLSSIKMAGFVTHSTQMPSEGERQRILYAEWAGYCQPTFVKMCKDKNIPFRGYFHCQGKPSPGIAEFIHRNIVTDDDEWEEYIADAMIHPNQGDMEDAKLFAFQVLQDC